LEVRAHAELDAATVGKRCAHPVEREVRVGARDADRDLAVLANNESGWVVIHRGHVIDGRDPRLRDAGSP
jgi:hypothetical protein